MEHYYHFFVSSLPGLKLFAPAPWSIEDFMEECARNISAADLNLVKTTEFIPQNDIDFPSDSMTFAWTNFEKQLRNRIVRQIAKQSDESSVFERVSKGCYPEVELAVLEAWNQINPLEREKILDLWRWRFLEHQEARRPFGSIGFICMYKIKLQIVEKWQKRQTEAGQKNLTRILEESSAQRAQKPQQ